ncbi:MAG TPA: LuxR C-terminal-related transcriptional regulator [Bacillota bacterium]|nr:LuxR C-terminal-related transcriptional regulator [Bacillota bacterium]
MLTEQFKVIGATKIAVPGPGNEDINFDKMDLEIIRYLAKGYINREIAENISFSEGTVKNRISRLLSLTGLKDRSQIVVFALKNGIV